MLDPRNVFAAKGEIINDESGNPAWEFVEDVYPNQRILSRQIVKLPEREHPQPHSVIPPEVQAWHIKKTGRPIW